MKESRFTVRCDHIHCDRVMGRLIRNPGYGGPSVGLNSWCWRPSISNHTKPGFHTALCESIEKEGIRNPILLWALPEGVLLTFGGSRLKAAREVGLLDIPAIINDYTGEFNNAPEVTPDTWRSFFTDPPKEFEFGPHGVDYHYNLERARRHAHDPAGFAWLNGGEPQFIREEFPWLLND